MSWKEFKNALSLPIACLKQCNILNLDFQAHHGLVPSTFPTLLLSAPHTPHSSCSRLISLFGRPVLWFAHLSITCEAKSDLAYNLWTKVNCKDGFLLYWVKIHFPKKIFTCWSWFSAFGIYDLYLRHFHKTTLLTFQYLSSLSFLFVSEASLILSVISLTGPYFKTIYHSNCSRMLYFADILPKVRVQGWNE